MNNATDIMLTAIYTNARNVYVRVEFLENGEIEYVAGGDVTDEELTLILNAGGADVDGFACELS